MHSGEEWFQIGWPQYVFLGTLLVVYLMLVFTKNLPSMKSFQEFTDTINSAGGHIIILSIFSGWFFLTAMRFFFHVLGLPDEVITKHDAIIMTGVGFLTGTAFGGAWGALIKTMSGGKANGTLPTSSLPDGATPISPVPAAAPDAPRPGKSATLPANVLSVGTPPATPASATNSGSPP